MEEKTFIAIFLSILNFILFLGIPISAMNFNPYLESRESIYQFLPIFVGTFLVNEVIVYYYIIIKRYRPHYKEEL